MSLGSIRVGIVAILRTSHARFWLEKPWASWHVRWRHTPSLIMTSSTSKPARSYIASLTTPGGSTTGRINPTIMCRILCSTIFLSSLNCLWDSQCPMPWNATFLFRFSGTVTLFLNEFDLMFIVRTLRTCVVVSMYNLRYCSITCEGQEDLPMDYLHLLSLITDCTLPWAFSLSISTVAL